MHMKVRRVPYEILNKGWLMSVFVINNNISVYMHIFKLVNEIVLKIMIGLFSAIC